MNETKEQLLERMRDDLSVMSRWKQYKKTIMEMPPEQMTDRERYAADYFSKSFEENLEEARERWRDSIGLKHVAKMLGLTVQSVRGLPVPNRGLWEDTSRGRLLVTCYWKSEIVAYLISLNPTFADYTLDEQLLRPEDVIEVCTDCDAPISVRALGRLRTEGRGPDCVLLGPRSPRYRLIDVLRWLSNPDSSSWRPMAPSELIMRGCRHDS